MQDDTAAMFSQVSVQLPYCSIHAAQGAVHCYCHPLHAKGVTRIQAKCIRKMLRKRLKLFAGASSSKAVAATTNADTEYSLDDDELLALAATQLDGV